MADGQDKLSRRFLSKRWDRIKVPEVSRGCLVCHVWLLSAFLAALLGTGFSLLRFPAYGRNRDSGRGYSVQNSRQKNSRTNDTMIGTKNSSVRHGER